jgi:hypothetical protein
MGTRFAFGVVGLAKKQTTKIPAAEPLRLFATPAHFEGSVIATSSTVVGPGGASSWSRSAWPVSSNGLRSARRSGSRSPRLEREGWAFGRWENPDGLRHRGCILAKPLLDSRLRFVRPSRGASGAFRNDVRPPVPLFKTRSRANRPRPELAAFRTANSQKDPDESPPSERRRSHQKGYTNDKSRQREICPH